MLQKLNFKPGFNKQITESGAESQWVDGDFVRFRYGLPEKIGGWSQLTNALLNGRYVTFSSVTVPTNSGYATTDFTGNTFEVLNKTASTFQITMPSNSSASSTTLNGGLQDDTAGTGGTGTSIALTSTSGFATSGIISVGLESISYTGVSVNNLTGITRAVSGTRSAHSSGAVVSTGSARIDPYEIVGPTFQTAGLGWGTSTWGASTWGFGL